MTAFKCVHLAFFFLLQVLPLAFAEFRILLFTIVPGEYAEISALSYSVPDSLGQIPDDGGESEFCTEEEFTVTGLGPSESVPLYANDVSFEYGEDTVIKVQNVSNSSDWIRYQINTVNLVPVWKSPPPPWTTPPRSPPHEL